MRPLAIVGLVLIGLGIAGLVLGQFSYTTEKTVIDVDRYGNTSSGSIPLALADAQADGRLRPGCLVLMTGMGAGLTWGSALMRWTKEAV